MRPARERGRRPPARAPPKPGRPPRTRRAPFEFLRRQPRGAARRAATPTRSPPSSMKVAREFFERAILFVVKNDEARGLGGFGLAPREETLNLARAPGRDPARRGLGLPRRGPGPTGLRQGPLPRTAGWATSSAASAASSRRARSCSCRSWPTARRSRSSSATTPRPGATRPGSRRSRSSSSRPGIALENVFLQRKLQRDRGQGPGPPCGRIPVEVRANVARTSSPARARTSCRSSPRRRSSPRSCSRRTSGCASRSPRSRRRAGAQAADERVQALQQQGPGARGEARRDRGPLPQGRGGEQGVRRPLHRDRGAEQQPGEPLRGLLPAPLHPRLQGGRADRPGDRHQPHRRRGRSTSSCVSEKTGQLEVEASEGQTPAPHRDPARRRHHRQGGPERRELLRGAGGAQGALALRGADRGHPPEDQGLHDRRHLDQQAPRPEDAVHDDGLRAVHPARRPRRHRDLLGQALLDLRAEAHARSRASWTCSSGSDRVSA
ncbi:MAG: hypothetical protein MZV64_11720 [Ignavibacteriales bacterium]|nr:hypothetical protein [Ignavibacteriales bacterium]